MRKRERDDGKEAKIGYDLRQNGTLALYIPVQSPVGNGMRYPRLISTAGFEHAAHKADPSRYMLVQFWVE